LLKFIKTLDIINFRCIFTPSKQTNNFNF